MLQALSNIITGFGLSASAGLNAYIPLLIVALLGRFTSLIHLKSPYEALTSVWVIGLLTFLVLVEAFMDKIPAVDTAYNLIQTVARPAAGAILFAASSHVVSDVHPVLALICGLLIAGTVHAAKTTARPVVTVATVGAGNAGVSTVEDVVAAATSLLAVIIPIVALILIVIGTLLLVHAFQQTRSQA